MKLDVQGTYQGMAVTDKEESAGMNRGSLQTSLQFWQLGKERETEAEPSRKSLTLQHSTKKVSARLMSIYAPDSLWEEPIGMVHS